jgi:hypothetical protein
MGTTMKSFVIATLFASTALAASAMSGNGETYGQDAGLTGASKSRAEVIAELREAQAAGTLAYGESSLKRDQSVMPAASRLTRAEVRMDLAEAGQGTNDGIYRN